jgi:Creatinine amidohydrolase
MRGDEHAGEQETSSMLAIRPDLVKMDRASDEDGSDLKRLADLPNIWTATSWYARFPNHYAGVGFVRPCSLCGPVEQLGGLSSWPAKKGTPAIQTYHWTIRC